MQILQHDFTQTIISILNQFFPGYGDVILNNSQLLQYINIKTKAANRGSKSRASFANHYAILKKLFYKIELSLIWKMK
jgi:hypothetical protein